MKILYLFIFLILLFSLAEAQPGWGGSLGKIRWDQLDEEVSDSLEQRAVPMVTDTAALKIHSRTAGKVVFVKQYSAWFVAVDSAYAEGSNKGAAYEHPTAGLQWVAESYLRTGSLELEFFGATGDGTTNDSLAIQNAFFSNIPLIGRSGATYNIGNGISAQGYDIDLSPSSEEPFKFRIDTTDFSGTGLYIGGAVSTTDTSSLADTIHVNTQIATVKDGSIFSVGDIVIFDSNQQWPVIVTSGKGEIHKIAYVEADTIHIEDHFWDSYDHVTDSVLVKKVNTNKVNIRGMILKTDSIMTSTSVGIILQYTDKASIEKCTISGFWSANVYAWYNYNFSFTNGNLVEDNIRAIRGYGLYIGACNYVKILGNHFQNNTQNIDLAEISGNVFPSRNIQIMNNTFSGGNVGVHTHSGAENVSIIGNSFANHVVYGLAFKGSDVLIADNKFNGDMPVCISIASHAGIDQGGSNVVVSGNVYSPSLIWRETLKDTYWEDTPHTFIQFIQNDTSLAGYTVVDNNKAYGIRALFINFSSAAPPNMVVSNNVCVFQTQNAAATFKFQGAGTTIRNGRMVNNDIRIMRESVIQTYTYTSITNWDNADWNGDRNEYVLDDTLTTHGYTFSPGTLIDYFWSRDSLLASWNTGDTTYMGGKVNSYSLHYTGTLDDLSYGTVGTAFVVDTLDFTAGFWVKQDSLGATQQWWGQRRAADYFIKFGLTTTNHLYMWMKTPDRSQVVYLLADGVADTLDTDWHWVMYSIDRDDASNSFIYLDGDTLSSYSTRTVTADTLNVTSGGTFGGNTIGEFFGGYIYESVFWADSALTYAQNTILYNGGVPIDMREVSGLPKPDNYPKFYEGSGTPTYDIKSSASWIVSEPTYQWTTVKP